VKLDLHTVDCIGGMRPLTGTAPFASASLVVREREASHRIARVSRYEGETHAVGEPLTPEEWQTLCVSEHAHAFAEPVPIRAGACMWLLRQSFDGRDAALAELRAAGVSLELMYDGRTNTKALVVHENEANPLRDGWAGRAYGLALEQARLERWSRALALAEQAYVLGRGPIPSHWALLTLCYERVGQAKRAEGLVQVARRSHGEAMGDDVVALRGALEAELAGAAPLITASAIPQPAMKEESRQVVAMVEGNVSNELGAADRRPT
jgi:hypothetical protein